MLNSNAQCPIQISNPTSQKNFIGPKGKLTKRKAANGRWSYESNFADAHVGGGLYWVSTTGSTTGAGHRLFQ